MRVFAACIGTESNTFSAIPTSWQDYEAVVCLRPGEHSDEAPRMCTATLWRARQRAAADGMTLIEGSCFAASPGGVTNREAYESMRDEILGQLQACSPVDAVLLGLHGAMIAYGHDDVEGDLLERMREIVGPDCVIAAELDPHCHLTLKRVELADIIVMYKEYPHTDVVERADETITLMQQCVRGKIKPVMAVYDCRQIGSYPTTAQPMRQFIDWVMEREKAPGVLSISVGHSYPYADVPEMGARVLAVTDNDKVLASSVAREVGEAFLKLRGKTTPRFLAPDEALAVAMAAEHGPVVMTDAADNAGGGAASDNTTVLRLFIDNAVASAAFAPLWDPQAVNICFAAGLGSKLRLRFGGKASAYSGQPIDAEVEIIGLARSTWQSNGPVRANLGDAAAIRIGGVEVVMCTTRTQAYGLEVFTHLGIDPRKKKVLVLKSSNHFRAAYEPIAERILHIHSDGLLQRADYAKIPYRRVQRPIWPLDEETRPNLVF